MLILCSGKDSSYWSSRPFKWKPSWNCFSFWTWSIKKQYIWYFPSCWYQFFESWSAWCIKGRHWRWLWLFEGFWIWCFKGSCNWRTCSSYSISWEWCGLLWIISNNASICMGPICFHLWICTGALVRACLIDLWRNSSASVWTNTHTICIWTLTANINIWTSTGTIFLRCCSGVLSLWVGGTASSLWIGAGSSQHCK